MPAQQPVNPWSHKPWWCQPWSILLTGITLMGGSWVLWKTIWVTVVVSLPVLIWMSFFLLLWPQLMKNSGLLPEQLPEASQRMENPHLDIKSHNCPD
jgi:hypothetical protein